MQRLTTSGTAIAVAVMGALNSAQAETRQHGAHDHGVAQLLVAQEGNHVTAVLRSPAFNILGFETLTDDSQRSQIHQAEELLLDGDALFDWGLAECVLKESVIHSSLFEEAEHELHDDHAESEDEHHESEDEHGDEHDEHDDHDKDDKHDEHDEHEESEEHHEDEHHEDEHHEDEHDHEDEEGDGHSDIEVNWEWHCEQPQQWTGLSVQLFEQFENLESLQLQVIGESIQAAYTLSPSASTVRYEQ